MKLAEAKVIEKTRGESPVLLLDDVLSDLDTKRRKRLLESISVGQQVLITATDTDKLDSGLLDNSIEYEIEDGNIRKC
jgi:DNA replication and repair protein RecF